MKNITKKTHVKIMQNQDHMIYPFLTLTSKTFTPQRRPCMHALDIYKYIDLKLGHLFFLSHMLNHMQANYKRRIPQAWRAQGVY